MSKLSYQPDFDVYPSYKGGHTLVSNGYIFELCPGHRLQNAWGYVAQHRLIAEDIIGRELVQHSDQYIREVVHHIDENRLNNSRENLQIMTAHAHMSYHGKQNAERNRKHLTEQLIIDALNGRTLKQAARLLKVDVQTMRTHFPHLVSPRSRKTPARIDNPKLIDLVLEHAPNKDISLRESSKIIGIGILTIHRICVRNGVKWQGKYRRGRANTKYRKNPNHPRWLKADARKTEFENK